MNRRRLGLPLAGVLLGIVGLGLVGAGRLRVAVLLIGLAAGVLVWELRQEARRR